MYNYFRRMLIVSLLLSSFALGALGFVGLSVNNIASKVQIINGPVKLAKSNPLPESFLAALRDTGSHEAMNVLLLGSDTRIGQGKGLGAISGARSDTVMLIHLNAARTGITVLSFPRDLWITLPMCRSVETGKMIGGYGAKFNAAFSNGGPDCAIKAVAQTSGLPVHHVIVVDFKGFAKIIDAIGGLPVCLPIPINDVHALIHLPAGQQTLNGTQALGLARVRKTIGDGGDLGRIDRQQAIMSRVVAQARKAGLSSDPLKFYKVASIAASALTVDEGLKGLPALAALAWQMKKIPTSHVYFLTVPNLNRGDGANVILNPSASTSVFQEILNDTVPVEAKAKFSDPAVISTPSSSTTSPAATASSYSGNKSTKNKIVEVTPTPTSAPTSSSSSTNAACVNPLW
jgi:LCP family protein required for cell wall assembly